MAPLPPPPPPPPAALPKSSSGPKAASSSKQSSEPQDINALLGQIRKGTNLKKVTQINDRSAPIISAGSNKSSSSTPAGPITPSMFKNGQGPLNIALALKPPGGITLKPTPKSSTDTVSRSLSNAAAATPSAQNRKPSFASTTGKTSSTTTTSVIKQTPTERPSVKPPPLPVKPPVTGVNRRQSFDSGQLKEARGQSSGIGGIASAAAAVAAKLNSNFNSQSSASNSSSPAPFSYSSATLKPTSSSKPAPPPRSMNTTSAFSSSNLTSLTSNFGQLSTSSNQSALSPSSYASQTLKLAPSLPAGAMKFKSAQNLNQMSVSTPAPPPPLSKPRGSIQVPGKTSTMPRPMHEPPPPPSHRLPASGTIISGSGNVSSGSSSSLSSTSGTNIGFSNAAPSPRSAAPTPPSASQATTSTASRSFGQLHTSISSQLSPIVVPVPPMRNASITKSDLESRFQHSFQDISSLPPPEPMRNNKKQYPSAANREAERRRRNAPLPPMQQPPGHSFSHSPALMNV